ncbi:MAG TPA: hypothetical protein VEF04_00425, partial [Blastocatellia bacterium]|nr:hypothetical protein [Blastocatellia bacterium]
MTTQNIPKTQITGRLLLIPAAAFVLLWLVSYISLGLYEVLHFDGFPANGPFQLFNPLRRIADGQRAGVDFQFFHGIGVPFLHFPLFWLFGKTIFASELSRSFTSLICYLLSLGIFAYAATGGHIKKSFYFTTAVLWFSEMFVIGRPGMYGNPLATPGNSLLGVRSTMPIIVFALLLSRLPQNIKALSVGVAYALTLYFGTEHGLALNVSFGFIGSCVLIKSLFESRRNRNYNLLFTNIRFYLQAVLSALFSGAIIYLLTCGPRGALRALRYNLVEVPADQFWYFGVPPNDFASTFADFPHTTIKGTVLFVVAVICLFCCLLHLFRSSKVASDDRTATIAQMLCYGLISCASCLGMLERGYLMPLMRVSLLALLTFIFQSDILAEIGNKLLSFSSSTQRILKFGATACLLLAFSSVALPLYARIPPSSLISPAAGPELSTLWKQRMAEAKGKIDAHLTPNERPVIWSTYAGLLEEHYQAFHPKDDYIIHALGRQRREAYLTAFRATQPKFVQTVRPSLFISYTEKRNYEQWLRNTSWDFYEDVLNNYDVLTTTDSSIFWVKRTSMWANPNESFTTLPTNQISNCIDLPATNDANGIVVVRLKYQINNPWKELPFVGGLPRHLVFPENV